MSEAKRIARIKSEGLELGAPLSDEAIAAFEASARVALPPEYRAFLREVGNGGDGPGQSGLLALGTVCDFWHGAEEMISRLARPFASRSWIDESETKLRAPKMPAGSSDGVLQLASDGCAQNFVLVVTGKARGEVWQDASGGIYPCAPNFLSWFEVWLDAGKQTPDIWPYTTKKLRRLRPSAPKAPVGTPLDRIPAKIKAARATLGPPVSEADLATFEKRARITLPPELRTFLATIGNGSKGRPLGPPQNGLLPLGAIDEDHHLTADEMIARASKPFYGRPWHTDDYDAPPASADDGVLVLGSDADASAYVLVVTGSARGEVWKSCECDLVRVAPDFATWVETWLDRIQPGMWSG